MIWTVGILDHFPWAIDVLNQGIQQASELYNTAKNPTTRGRIIPRPERGITTVGRWHAYGLPSRRPLVFCNIF